MYWIKFINGQQEAEITIEFEAEVFSKAIKKVYDKHKARVSIPGFRRGKAPLKMLINFLGKKALEGEAVQDILPDQMLEILIKERIELVEYKSWEIKESRPDGSVVVFVLISIIPKANISDYKNLSYVELEVPEVTEESIKLEIDKELDKNSRVTSVEREIREGDLVNIDYFGLINGKSFENGEKKGYEIEMGKHQVIAAVENALYRRSAGDKFDMNATFPDDYHVKNIAGKTAEFRIIINKVYEKDSSEFNDDFVQDTSEFNTTEEYIEDLRKRLNEERDKKLKKHAEFEIKKKLLGKIDLEIPDEAINNRIDDMIIRFQNDIRRDIGISFEEYLRYTNQDIGIVREIYRKDAENEIKLRAGLYRIAELENLFLKDEDREQEVLRMVDNNETRANKLLREIRKDKYKLWGVTRDIEMQRALDFVVANAVIKEKSEEDENQESDNYEDEDQWRIKEIAPNEDFEDKLLLEENKEDSENQEGNINKKEDSENPEENVNKKEDNENQEENVGEKKDSENQEDNVNNNHEDEN